MNYSILHDELVDDPLGRGYSGMTDEQAATDLNTLYRTRSKTQLSSAEIYEQIDVAEFQALGDAQKVYVRDILGLGEGIDVRSGSKARTVLINVFGAGSNTITALAAAVQETISRATELGLGIVNAGDVIKARAYGG